MRRMIFVMSMLAACGGDDDGGGPDAVNPNLPRCYGAGPFGTPVATPALANINTAETEGTARLSADGLTMFLTVDGRLGVSTRASLTDAFPVPTIVIIEGQQGYLTSPALTADGRTLYYSYRTSGLYHTWRSARAADGAISEGTMIPELRRPEQLTEEIMSYILPDESAIYFSDRTDIKRAEMQASGTFAAPVVVPGVESGLADFTEYAFAVTPDETIAVLGSVTFEGLSDVRLFTRTSRHEAFGAPVSLGTGYMPSWISPDGCTMYAFGPYDGDETTRFDVLEATREP